MRPNASECEAACETPRALLGPRCPLIMSRRHSRLGAVAIAFASGLSEPVGALATLVLLQSVVTQVTHKEAPARPFSARASPPPPPYCCPYPCPYCTLPLLTTPPDPRASTRWFQRVLAKIPQRVSVMFCAACVYLRGPQRRARRRKPRRRRRRPALLRASGALCAPLRGAARPSQHRAALRAHTRTRSINLHSFIPFGRPLAEHLRAARDVSD
jgi:hypothetical protein